MRYVRRVCGQFLREERAMETVEWAILAALIIAGLVVTITALGGNILNKFNALCTATN